MSGTRLNDATVQIQIGGQWAAGTPTYPAIASFIAVVRELNVEDNLEMVDVRGAGVTRAKNRFTVGQAKLSMKHVMPAATGYNFKTIGGTTPLGAYIKITTKPHSALTTAEVWEGIITKWSASQSMDTPSIEDIEVMLDFDTFS